MVPRNPNRGSWKLTQRMGLVKAQEQVNEAEQRLQVAGVAGDWGEDWSGAVCAQLFSALCVGHWDRARAVELVAEAYVIARDARGKR